MAATAAHASTVPPAGWAPPPPASGPWGPDVQAPADGWPQEPPPGWNRPATAWTASALGDPADDAGWLPVSASARAGRSSAATPGVCWNCGQDNGRNRDYCKRCGQRLDSDLGAQAAARPLTPVAGGRGRRAVAFIWTVLLLAAVVVVGVIAFGGFIPRGPDDTPPVAAASLDPSPGTMLASAIPGAGASPGKAASPGASASSLPGPSPDALASPAATGPGPVVTLAPRATPTATPSAAPTPRPTPSPAPTLAPPSATPSPTPRRTAASTLKPLTTSTPGPVTTTASPRAPAPAAFECRDAGQLRDPLNRAWTLSGAYWAGRADYDRVTLRLVPDETRGDAVTRVAIETMPIEELALGLPAPQAGDVATVIRFSRGVSLARAIQGLPDKAAVKAITTLTGCDDRVYVVLGVVGRGCHAIQAPMWADPSTQDTPFVDITVDIQH